MELKIISEQTKVIPRKELKIEIKFDNITPKRLELKKLVAKKTNSKEELIIIKNIYNN